MMHYIEFYIVVILRSMQGLCSSQNICYGSLNVSMHIIEIILNCTPILVINPMF
jgi:hypothetical protein